MLGKKVRVFWPLDQKWYVGVVQEFNPQTGEHLLIYPDGDDEWVRIGDNQGIATEGGGGASQQENMGPSNLSPPSPVPRQQHMDDMFFNHGSGYRGGQPGGYDKKRERDSSSIPSYDRTYTMAKLRASQQEHLSAQMTKNVPGGGAEQPTPEYKQQRPNSPIDCRMGDSMLQPPPRQEGHHSPTSGYPPEEPKSHRPQEEGNPPYMSHPNHPGYGMHYPPHYPPQGMHYPPPPPMHYQHYRPQPPQNMEEKESDETIPSGPPTTGKRKSGPKTWTKEEDAILLNMVQNMRMPMKWSIVAQSMPDRTGKQCRERYVNHLNPRLKNSEWSPQEDATIFHLYNSVGSQWAKMSKMIPGRTDNGIKNRFHNLRRQLEREDDHRLRLSKPQDFPEEIHLDRIRESLPQDLQGKNHALWDMFKGIGIIAAQSVIGAGVARNQGKFGPFKVPDPTTGELCARCGLFVPSIQCGEEICERTKVR